MILDIISRRYYSIYVKDGNIYKEYKRIKHFFKKDEFVLNRKMSVELFRHEVIRFETVCYDSFYNHYLVLDDE